MTPRNRVFCMGPVWIAMTIVLACDVRSVCADPAVRKLCFVTHSGLNPIQEFPAKTIDVTRVADFMQEFRYSPQETYQYETLSYHKLYGANDRVFGYVDSRYVLVDSSAMKVPISADDVVLKKSGAQMESGVTRKVRLANSIESLAGKSSTDESVKFIRCYTRPDSDAKHQLPEPYEIKTLFYVYQEVADFYLVGSDPNIRTGEHRRVIRGWIPKDRCIEWNTRLAVEWNWRNQTTRTMPGVLFSEGATVYDERLSFDQFRKYLKENETVRKEMGEVRTIDAFRALMERHKVYIYERVLPSSQGMRFVRMLPTEARMPYLREIDLSEFARNDQPVQKYHAYRVAAAAAVHDEISQEERKSLQEKLDSIAEGTKRLDVLLAIDATASMRESIVASVAALAQLAVDLRSESTLSVRFAVCFYRDKRDNAKNWFQLQDYVPLPTRELAEPATLKALQDLVKALNDERAANRETQKATAIAFAGLQKEIAKLNRTVSFFEMLQAAYKTTAEDGGADPQESVFGAIQEALGTAKGDQLESLRLLIVIGDRGDNGDSPEASNTVISLLNPRKRVPLALSVINVATPRDGVPEDVGLEADFQAICDQHNRQFHGAVLPKGPTQIARIERASRPADVTSLIVDQVELLKTNAEQARQQLRDAMIGTSSAVTSPYALSGLKAKNVDVEKLKTIRGAEIYRTALLTFERDLHDSNAIDLRNDEMQKRCVRLNILMNGVDIGRLRDALNQIVADNIRGDQIQDGDSLHGVVQKAVEIIIGAPPKGDVGFDKAMKMVSGLPTRSPLLSGDRKKFDELVRDPEKLRNELERLTEVRQRLDDLLLDKYSRLVWTDIKNKDGFPLRRLDQFPETPFPGNPKRYFPFGTVEAFNAIGQLTNEKQAGEKSAELRYYWVDAEREYP